MNRGSMYWAVTNDLHGGKPKERPVIVLSTSEWCEINGSIFVVVCSHSAYSQLAYRDDLIEIPTIMSHGMGCTVQLQKRTVAVCSWVGRFSPATLRRCDKCGHVSSEFAIQLLSKIAELHPGSDFGSLLI